MILSARVVGGLPMLDRGEADDKIVAVLLEDLQWGDVREIAELPQVLIDRLRHYFATYKQLPGGATPSASPTPTVARTRSRSSSPRWPTTRSRSAPPWTRATRASPAPRVPSGTERPAMLENAAIADLLDEVADLLELKKSDSFRIRAYRNASRSVRTLGVRLADLIERGSDLKQIPGIGSTIADEIRQMQSTGTTERREKLREGVPPGLLELLRLPGIGPRKAWDLWTKAQVGSIADLRAAVESKRIRELPGMGEKTEDSLRKALENVKPDAPGSTLLQGRARAPRGHRPAPGRDRGDRALGGGGQLSPQARDDRRPRRPDRDQGRTAHRRRHPRLRRHPGRAGPGRRRRARQARRRAPGRLPLRRGRRVRRGADVLHRLQGAQHRAAPARDQARLQAQRVRSARRERPARRGQDRAGRLQEARLPLDRARAARGRRRDRRRRAWRASRLDRARRSARRSPRAHDRVRRQEHDRADGRGGPRARLRLPRDHRPLEVAAHRQRPRRRAHARARGAHPRDRRRARPSSGFSPASRSTSSPTALSTSTPRCSASSTGWSRACTRRSTWSSSR